MNNDELYDIQDLLPKNDIIWGDYDELDCWKDDPWTYEKWKTVLGHESAHPGCCKSCGCCAPCALSIYYDGVISMTIKQLNDLGLLNKQEAINET